MRAQLIGNGLLVARIAPQPAAVLASLQLQAAGAEGLLSLDDAGWKEVLSFCDRTQLTLPFALRSLRGFPVWVNERLQGNLDDSARRFAVTQRTYEEVAAALDGAGVPHVVLKGFVQEPDFVRAARYRMQSDIDLYTDPESLLAGVQALEGIGYESCGPADVYRFADHVPTLTRFREWTPEPNAFDPEMPLALDLHHCLWNAPVSMIQLPEVSGFWSRRVRRTLGHLSFPALSAVDYLGYFALHVLRELFSASRVVHHALELATFLHERADDTPFWTEWQSMHSPRLRQMQTIPLVLAAETFSGRIPDAVHEQFRNLSAELRTWIEMCGGDLIAQTYRRTRSGRLLQFLLADSPGARRAVLWRALSPGEIAGPRKVAAWPEHAIHPKLPQRRRLSRYPAYLASRISINCAAVARFVVNSLTILLSSVAQGRGAASQ